MIQKNGKQKKLQKQTKGKTEKVTKIEKRGKTESNITKTVEKQKILQINEKAEILQKNGKKTPRKHYRKTLKVNGKPLASMGLEPMTFALLARRSNQLS